MQMSFELPVDFKKRSFNFSVKQMNGLKEIIYGKGIMFIIMCFFMGSFLLGFFFVLPLNRDLGLLVLRVFLFVLFLSIVYIYAKSVVEIVIEDDNLKVRTLKKYRKIHFDKILLIKIYRFSTWGIATIFFKTLEGSNLYFLWEPSFEPERHLLFSQFVDYIKQESGGRFMVSVKR